MIAGLIILLLLALTTLCTLYYRSQQTIKNQEERLKRYARTYLRLSGWSIGIGAYDCMSFDAGKTWHDVERAESGVRILGSANMDNVHSAQGMRALFDHVLEHGPLDLTSSKDMSMLGNAGFSVKTEK